METILMMKLIVLVIILILTSITNSIAVIIDINEDTGSDINEVTEYNDNGNVGIIYTSDVNRSYENKLPSLPKILKKGILSGCRS